VEGRQEVLFDQDFKLVRMDSKKRKWPFLDVFQWPGKKFSSHLEECVAPPSCSKHDVGDPNLFLDTIQSIRSLHISSKLF
jgi:hypothetical protein